MNAQTIKDILDPLPGFLGVYPSDLLPKTIQRYPASIVVNLDNHKEEGSHWISIYFDGNKRAFYFDSFAMGPVVPSIKCFMNNNSLKRTYNRRRLQALTSSVCGVYCVLYVIHRTKKKSTCGFFKKFSRNYVRNDVIVSKLFKRIVGQIPPA